MSSGIMVVCDPMKTNRQTLILAAVTFIVLGACSSQEPIRIIITPTPQPSSETPTPPPVASLPATASPTSTEEVTGQAATFTPTFSGPIIGPDYVLPTLPPPTIVIPTITPTPEPPTPVPSPTNTAGPSPTPIPRLDASRMGLQLYSQVDFDSWMRVIGLAEGTGVGWVKIQVNWAFLQPNGPNDFGPEMQLFEQQIEAVARPGFNILLSIAKAPAWARSDRTESGPPDNPQALAEFITFMLGTKIGPVVDAIEIWNEPNLIREWRGTIPFSGAGYMRLFSPAYDAVRAYSPSIRIVTAGLAPTGTQDGAINDREYLQQMYDAGLSSYGDDIAVGVHPYGWGNPPDARCCDMSDARGWDDDPHFFFLDTLEHYREIMVANGHQALMLWPTEFGWATWEGIPSEPPDLWMAYNTAQNQADYAIRAFEIGQSLPYVGPMMLWNLNFANLVLIEQRREIAAYSIINPAVFPSERPLYWALARATGELAP